MDPFIEAQLLANKCAAISTRLATITDLEETFVQTSCAIGQPCKPQLAGLIYGPQANRPTIANLTVGQMTTALCVVTLNPVNNTWECVQPHTDIADPIGACVILKKIIFPDHLDARRVRKNATGERNQRQQARAGTTPTGENGTKTQTGAKEQPKPEGA